MVIGKYLLEILAILIFLSIISTMVMYHFGIGLGSRKRTKSDAAPSDRDK